MDKETQDFILQELLIEERAGAENAVHRRMAEIACLPHSTARASFFSAALVAASAQAIVELQGPQVASRTLRHLADRLDKAQQ